MRRRRKFQISILCVIVLFGLLGCTIQTPVLPPNTPVPEATETPSAVVDVTIGGWRISTEQWNEVIAAFNAQHPTINARFEPFESSEYDNVIEAQLASGTALDLIYLRSFSASHAYYDAGYFAPLDELPGLQENFDEARLAPWRLNGHVYGVPLAASSHGIYYNVDAFESLGFAVPQTWETLLATAKDIQDAGYNAFANGTADAWPIAETIFMSMAPNFTGGREGRLQYLNGERCFNDADMVAAFEGVRELAAFFPPDHALLGYVDSLQMFVQGKALMWMSGSWDISYFEKNPPEFTWSAFAIPAPAGRPTYVVFHPDVGIGLTANSSHAEEAKVFLEWMTTTEFADIFGNKMVGLYPMHNQIVPLENEHSNVFLAFNDVHETDIRFAWEALRSGTPSGYTLMQENAAAVIAGTLTAQQAADNLQDGLATWFAPAQDCE